MTSKIVEVVLQKHSIILKKFPLNYLTLILSWWGQSSSVHVGISLANEIQFFTIWLIFSSISYSINWQSNVIRVLPGSQETSSGRVHQCFVNCFGDPKVQSPYHFFPLVFCCDLVGQAMLDWKNVKKVLLGGLEPIFPWKRSRSCDNPLLALIVGSKLVGKSAQMPIVRCSWAYLRFKSQLVRWGFPLHSQTFHRPLISTTNVG